MSDWIDWTQWSDYMQANSPSTEPEPPTEESSFFDWFSGSSPPTKPEEKSVHFVDSISVTYEQALEEVHRLQSAENLLEAVTNGNFNLFIVSTVVMIFTVFLVCALRITFRGLVRISKRIAAIKLQKNEGQRAPDQAEPVTGKKLEDIEHMIKVQTKVMMDVVIESNTKLLEKTQHHFGGLVDMLENILQGNERRRKRVENCGDADVSDLSDKIEA